MSDRKPLMPKATAAWLVENTSLTFEQIAEFCQMHYLEIKGIADGDVAAGIKGMDPVTSGQLTREEIQRGEQDHDYRLKIAKTKVDMPQVKTKRGPRYTPVSRRHDRPNAVLWLLRNHPELRDSQLMRLVGTTKPTILQIRERTHWNSPNLVPQDPVTLGLCSQTDLDAEVKKAAKRQEKERGPAAEGAGTLLPTQATTADVAHATEEALPEPEPTRESDADEAARVLARLKELSGKIKPDDDNDDDDAVDDNEGEDEDDDERTPS